MRRLFAPPVRHRKAVTVSDLQHQINVRIEAFVAEITDLARRQALATMSEAIGGARITGNTGRRGGSGASSRRSKGEKRPAGEIAAIAASLAEAVAGEPGLRIEEISKRIGTSTKELALPMKKLLAEGHVRSEGQRRATRYYPGDGTAATPRRRRGRRK
jgi:hypothetical protein